MPKSTHRGSELPMLTLKMVDGSQDSSSEWPRKRQGSIRGPGGEGPEPYKDLGTQGPEFWEEMPGGPFVFQPRLHNSPQGGVEEPLVCEVRNKEIVCREQMHYIFQGQGKHHFSAV